MTDSTENEQGAPVDWREVAARNEKRWKNETSRRLDAEAERDGAYRERAQLLAWIAALLPEGAAVLAPAADVDEPGWMILYLKVRGRQLSWHIAPRDLDVFEGAGIEPVGRDDERARWDGHTTSEKYERIAGIVRGLWERCGPECAEGHTYAGRCEISHPRFRVDVQPESPEVAEAIRDVRKHGVPPRRI